jgi:hypothetical protein
VHGKKQEDALMEMVDIMMGRSSFIGMWKGAREN